jgi:hypothetical protein
MAGSEPALCASHRPGRGGRRQQAGSQSFQPLLPGFYPEDPTAVTVDGAIAGLADKMRRLDALFACHDRQCGAAWPPDEALLQLFGLYSQASSRLSRLLRDRRALSGDAADGLAGAIGQALDELGTEWGVNL